MLNLSKFLFIFFFKFLVASQLFQLNNLLILRTKLNLPDIPYSKNLRRENSSEYIAFSNHIILEIDSLFSQESTYRNSSVYAFRFLKFKKKERNFYKINQN